MADGSGDISADQSKDGSKDASAGQSADRSADASADVSGAEAADPATPARPLREVLRGAWQVPTLIASTVALAGAAVLAIVTTPDPDFQGRLDRAERLVEADRFPEAIEVLNTQLLPLYPDSRMTQEHRGEFHLLMARSLYGGNEQLPAPQPENNRTSLEQYAEAERLGATLTPRDSFSAAESRLILGDLDRAQARAEEIGPPGDELRRGIMRRIIRARIAAGGGERDEVMPSLVDMAMRTDLPAEDRVWALARQADVRHEQGFHDETINQLLRQLPTLLGDDPGRTAPLHAALARAYLAVGAVGEAQRELDRIPRAERSRLDAELSAKILRLSGDAASLAATSRPDLEAARSLFEQVTRQYSDSAEYLPALLALAEIDAELGSFEDSIDGYRRIVAAYRRGDIRQGPDTPTREEISETLLEDAATELARGGDGIERALSYATEAANLYPIDELPPEGLDALRAAHQASAGRELRAALSLPDLPDGPPSPFIEGVDIFDLAALEPSTEQLIKRHLIRAAAYGRMHADRFIIDDINRYGDSLWNAAKLFDLAGDAGEAVRAFEEYHEAIADDDRSSEALFRLAQAYQAAGRHNEAQGFYRDLIRGASVEGVRRVGPWADRSRVPFARSLIYDGRPTNDEEAVELLRGVITGVSGGPESEGYSDALFEFASLRHRTGEHNEAVERFAELLERDPDYPRAASARYLLADAHRRLAADITERLAGEQAPSTERELERRRRIHLETALAGFQRVRDDLAERPANRLTAAERLELRNAHLYVGDCAFDLGDPDAAIGHYAVARSRYPADPAILVALTQIVSAYVAKGDMESARTANERARDFYASLPAEVWEDPGLPMGRDDWQRWLDSSAALYRELAQVEP